MHTQQTENKMDFDLFKSNVCHYVKDKGDVDFIIDTLSKD